MSSHQKETTSQRKETGRRMVGRQAIATSITAILYKGILSEDQVKILLFFVILFDCHRYFHIQWHTFWKHFAELARLVGFIFTWMVCSTPCLPLSVCVRRARRTHTLGWRSLDSVIAVSDQRQQKLADTHMPALCTLIIFLAPEQYFAKVFFGVIANIYSQPFLPSHMLSVVSWTLDHSSY